MPYIKYLFLFLCLSTSVFAMQDTLVYDKEVPFIQQQNITESDLETYKNDKNFDYTEVDTSDNWFVKLKRWFRNLLFKVMEYLFGNVAASGIVKFIFQVVPYIILAILVFLLIKFFLKVNARNIIQGKQNKPEFEFTDEEHIIKNEDINALITRAIEQNNYRLAIRYYYLLALKELSDHNVIKWEQDKTNADYINEIENKTLQTNFKQATKIYDYVWYGEFTVDAIKFESLKKPFNQLSKLSSNKIG
jgi:large-conductance mechanosensitive channel